MTRAAFLLVFASARIAQACTTSDTGSIDLAPRSVPRCAGVQCATGLRCNPANGRCVACLADADCTASRPHCQTFTCVECTTDAECAAPFPVCSVTLGACAECEEDADCRVAHVCEVTEGECEDAP